jgi:hypothetical protein
VLTDIQAVDLNPCDAGLVARLVEPTRGKLRIRLMRMFLAGIVQKARVNLEIPSTNAES